MSADFTPEKEDYKELPPFKMQVLTNFPYIEADFDALTNYQLLCKVVEYLNMVIHNENEVTEQITSLYNAYVSLQNYVNNYFDNLDVQEEINNKLDDMASDGTLTSLIGRYVQPLIDDQNEEIDAFKTLTNSRLDAINTRVDSAVSGSPLVASSTSEMTDTDRVYVNTTDGKWYYYDGDSWEIGGTYQSTALASDSIYSYQMTKSVCGTKFNFTGTANTQTPTIYFKFNNSFNMGDLASVGIKCKFTNNLEITLGSGTFTCWFWRTGWGQGVSFTGAFPGDVPAGGSVDLDLSKNASSTWTDVYPTHIGFRLDLAYSRIYNYDIENIEFYLNGDKLIYGKDFVFDYEKNPTEQTDISSSFEFLASKNYVDGLVSSINSDISDIEDDIAEIQQAIPDQEQLEILTHYAASTKSDLSKISCWGDSLTAGGYPDYMQQLMGENVTVTNNGKSGECSGEVAFREGGMKIYTASSILIPASNQESVSLTITCNPNYPSSLSRFNEKVIINGIEGTLTLSNGGWSFTRTSSGESTAVESETEIICASQTMYQDNLTIIWIGRNDVAFNNQALASIVPNATAMINHLNRQTKRFLVISPTTATDEYDGGSYQTQYNLVKSMESALETAFPYNYVDLEYYLVHQCLYDMGINPTSDDLINMERNTIPPSLMADTIHPTQATQQQIARFILNELKIRDWTK